MMTSNGSLGIFGTVPVGRPTSLCSGRVASGAPLKGSVRSSATPSRLLGSPRVRAWGGWTKSLDPGGGFHPRTRHQTALRLNGHLWARAVPAEVLETPASRAR